MLRRRQAILFNISIFSLIFSVLFAQSCTTSRYIFAKEDPERIPSKLKRSDIGKKIKVTLHEEEVLQGELIDFNIEKLTISEELSPDTVIISFQAVENISLKEKEVPGPLFLLFIGLAYLIYEFQKSMKGFSLAK